MIFDPEIYCTAAETAELDGTAPLALAGDGLWVGVLSRGVCLLDGVDRPGQSGDILLGPAPLVLTPQSDCHLLAVRLTGHCTDAYLLQLGAARWADGAACPGAAPSWAVRSRTSLRWLSALRWAWATVTTPRPRSSPAATPSCPDWASPWAARPRPLRACPVWAT